MKIFGQKTRQFTAIYYFCTLKIKKSKILNMGRAFEYRKAAKMKRWGHMSRVFPKLGKLITIAAKEGGPDPDMNPKLRQAIQNAKAENMPKENIDAAIKRATDKDAANLVEITHEGKGPFGIQCMVNAPPTTPRVPWPT